MLRRIMGIPGEVYYRGRFRASLVWTDVIRVTVNGSGARIVHGSPARLAVAGTPGGEKFEAEGDIERRVAVSRAG